MAHEVRHFFVSLTLTCLTLGLLLIDGGCGTPAPKTAPPLPQDDRIGDQLTENAGKMAIEGQFKSSNYFYKKAIANFEKKERWEKAIKCYIGLGDNFQSLDDNKSALAHLNLALNLTQKHLGYQPLELAKSFKKLAFKHLQKKDFDQSLELYRKALGIQLEVLGANHQEVAKTYNSISLVHWNRKDSTKAQKMYSKSYSIKLRRSIGVPGNIKKKMHLIGAKGDKFKKGEFKKARDHFNRSIAEYQKLYGNNNPLFAEIYDQIGLLFALERDFDNAIRYLRKSLAIRLETYGDRSHEVGESYLNIGICLRLKGDYTDAFSVIHTALTIKEELLGKYHVQSAGIYYQLGMIHYQMRQWNKALLYFQESLMALVPGFKDRNFHINPTPEKVYARDLFLEILSAKAMTLKMRYIREPERMDDLKTAYTTYLMLADLLETMRRSYKSESYKLSFNEKNHPLFKEAVQTAFLLYEMTKDVRYKEAAFIISEKSKAAVLAEALSEARARKFSGIPVALLEKERKLKAQLTHYDTYLERELAKKKQANPMTIKNLEDKYYTLLKTYRDMIDNFEVNYKKYYDLKYKPQTINIAALRRSLKADEALVEYFIGDSILHIFVLTPGDLYVDSVHLEEDLDQLVNTYHRSIKKIEEKPFRRLSRKLYSILVEPVYDLLEGSRRLIIIPDGSLYYIPFESLIANDARTSLSKLDYLIKHFSLTYHYSASLRSESHWAANLHRDNAFIGFAPVFSSHRREGYILAHDPAQNGETNLKRPHRGYGNPNDPVLSQLPATEEELHAIITLFKNQKKRAAGYFHKKATETAFKTAGIASYNLIHIATHSLDYKNAPQLAGLVFSPPSPRFTSAIENEDPKQVSNPNQTHLTALPSNPTMENAIDDPGDDGILYSGEIYNLKLDAELIVLSSCESGVGKLVEGEGMMALNRGFFYSGTRNIIFSLWKVEDRSTSRLMIAFYKNVLAGKPFYRALQKAKLELIANPYTAFPKYWSGFVLVGH
jgi:CHAT domain-containing protein